MDETTKLLRNAAAEIRILRRQNEILSAKVEVMDAFMCVLHTTPARSSQGMTPDLAWSIDRHLDRLSKSQPTGIPAPAVEA